MIFVGDIHGNFKRFLAELQTKSYQNTTLIQVGDFGGETYFYDQTNFKYFV